jgi:hypothetical protein
MQSLQDIPSSFINLIGKASEQVHPDAIARAFRLTKTYMDVGNSKVTVKLGYEISDDRSALREVGCRPE